MNIAHNVSTPIVSLGEISELITSGSRAWAEYYSESGALFLRMTNLPKEGIKILLHNTKYVSIPNDIEGQRTAVKTGDILISITAELGKIGYIEDDSIGEAYVNQHVCLVRLKTNKVNAKFVAYYLSAQKQRNLLNRFNDSGAKSGLNLSTINNFPINLPNIETQNKIVEILTIWDKAIEKTEALIAAKEKQFGSLLNKLIVKQSHIKGWKSDKLSHLTKIKKGQQLNRSSLTATDLFPAWNGGITPSGYTDSWNTLENTITISEGGNSCGFVNYCKEKFWCGGHCYALIDVAQQINVEFLYFFLKTHEKQIMSLRVGSGLPNIQRRDIENIEIFYPKLAEQKDITHILSQLRKEICILKKLTNNYSLQKRSLMQNILSGQLSLNTEEVK